MSLQFRNIARPLSRRERRLVCVLKGCSRPQWHKPTVSVLVQGETGTGADDGTNETRISCSEDGGFASGTHSLVEQLPARTTPQFPISDCVSEG